MQYFNKSMFREAGRPTTPRTKQKSKSFGGYVWEVKARPWQFMAVPRQGHGRARAVSWQGHDNAMAEPVQCHGKAMAAP